MHSLKSQKLCSCKKNRHDRTFSAFLCNCQQRSASYPDNDFIILLNLYRLCFCSFLYSNQHSKVLCACEFLCGLYMEDLEGLNCRFQIGGSHGLYLDVPEKPHMLQVRELERISELVHLQITVHFGVEPGRWRQEYGCMSWKDVSPSHNLTYFFSLSLCFSTAVL